MRAYNRRSKKLWFLFISSLLFVSTALPNPTVASTDITVSQDFSGTQRQVIDQTGGSVSVTLPNGVRATLTLPAGALRGPRAISLTPLGQVAQRFPFQAGIAAGVQAGPEGLVLLKPATLTFEYPEALWGTATVHFSHAEDGVDFHLYPATTDRTRHAVTFVLSHFSGYGSTAASGDETSRFERENPPTSRPSAAEQALAKAQRDYEQSEHTPEDADRLFSARAHALELWADQLAPNLDNLARSSDQAVSEEQVLDYWSEVQSWFHKTYVQGGVTEHEGELAQRMDTDMQIVFDNLAEQILRECWAPKGAKDLGKIAQKAFLYFTLAATLPQSAGDAASLTAPVDFSTKLRACFVFQLDLNSVIQTYAPRGNLSATLRATSTLSMNGLDPLVLTGTSSSARFTDATARMPFPPGCRVTFNHGAVDVSAQLATLNSTIDPINGHGRHPVRPGRPVPPSETPATDPAAPGPGTPPRVEGVKAIFLQVNNPQEELTLSCDIRGHSFSQRLGSFWNQGWQLSHTDDFAGPGSYLLGDWNQNGMLVRSVVATRDYHGSHSMPGGSSVNEITQITLTHAPEGRPGHNPPGFGSSPPSAEALRRTFRETIRPLIARMKEDEASIERSFSRIERWNQTALVYAHELAAERDEVRAGALDILNTLVSRESEACQHGDLKSGSRMLRWLKWAPNHDLIARNPSYDPTLIARKIEGCFRFSFSLDALLKLVPEDENARFEGRVTANVMLTSRLDIEKSTIELTATQPLEYQVSRYPQMEGCRLDVRPEAGTLQISEGSLKLRVANLGEEVIELQRLRIWLGAVSERVHAVCDEATQDLTTTLWSQVWQERHLAEQEISESRPIYTIRDFTIQSSQAPWALKHYETPDGNVTAEVTELRMNHQPLSATP